MSLPKTLVMIETDPRTSARPAEAIRIAADGPVRVINPRTGGLMDMAAEPAAHGATIVTAHALAFLLLACLAPLLRHDWREQSI